MLAFSFFEVCMKTKLASLSIFLGIIFPSSALFAYHPEHMDGNHEMAFMSAYNDLTDDPSLNLNKEQKEKIKKIFEASKNEMKKDRKELLEKMKIFQEVYIDTKKTDNDIAKYHNEIHIIRNKMAAQHFKSMLQLRSLLTSEQRKQFFEKMKDHKLNKNHRHEE